MNMEDPPMVRVVCAASTLDVSTFESRPRDELWLDRKELRQVTGWELKPEGLCRGEVCVPLPAHSEKYVDGENVNASGLWTALDRPVLHDRAHSTWLLGESAADRSRQLETLEAPDFTLPDIEGKLHSLSDYRGKKVFLSTWASW